MDTITLFAPLSGRLMPIEAIPDPIFAQKMAGEGLAIDPTSSTLLAPCDGEIIQMHPGQHTLTIANNNIEIVIHIGLNTSPLESEGFLSHVKAGDRVKSGQTLIEFDPDYVATNAASLLTVILIANPERIDQFYKSAGDIQAGQDVLMELTLVDHSALAAAGIYKPIISETITVPNQNGLHIRPAAVLSSLCRGFNSEITLRKGSEESNAKSVSSIMALNVGYHDTVRLSAAGPDAYEAISILTPAIINGLGEEGSTPIQAPASIILPAIAAPLSRPIPEDPQIINGSAAAPGLAIGYIFQLRPTLQELIETAGDPLIERDRLNQALAQTRLHLEALRSRTQAESNPGQAALLAAQHELLDDPDLLDMAYGAVDRGKSAEFAWMAATNTQAVRLERMDSDLLGARAADLREAGRRVATLISDAVSETPHLPLGAIVVTEDISAVRLANLDPARVMGLATLLGGPTSPTSELARTVSIPAISGIETRALDIANGTAVILDGTNAVLHLNPSAEEVAAAKDRQQEQVEQRRRNLATAFQPAATSDGIALQVQAAIAGVDEAHEAMRQGGDGICWLSTEHLFMSRRTAPSEDEQTIAYVDIANALAPNKPLTIRTLDVSSRQPLPYLPQAPEPNPALGLQGIRFTIDQPQLLRKQGRAILRAAAETGRPLQILLPMISTFDQWRTAKELIVTEQQKMEIEPVPIGLLIQVPAAAASAARFAREADFFTVDTDDLAQFSMAMDRHHPHLSGQVDALDPAVLQLIHLAVQGTRAHGKSLTISGAIAADPHALPILIGLGVSGLNVLPNAIPDVKALIGSLSMEACSELAQEAMGLDTAVQVRALTK